MKQSGSTVSTVPVNTKSTKDVLPSRTPNSSLIDLHVVDTCILINDFTALLKFEKDDIVVPLEVLSQLDRLKTELSVRGWCARNAIDLIAQIVEREEVAPIRHPDIGIGYPIDHDGVEGRGKLYLYSSSISSTSIVFESLSRDEVDNRLVAITHTLKKLEGREYRKVLFRSADLNVRVKARAFDIEAKDFHGDNTFDDASILTTGMTYLAPEFWEQLVPVDPSRQGELGKFRLFLPENIEHPKFLINHLVHNGEKHRFIIREITEEYLLIERIRNFFDKTVFGMNARNPEQNFAFHLLLDPTIKVVGLLGSPGSGKDFSTITAIFEQMQCLELSGQNKISGTGSYPRVIVTRPLFGSGEKIGFLPGNESAKVLPWMLSIIDNTESIVEILEKHGIQVINHLDSPEVDENTLQREVTPEVNPEQSSNWTQNPLVDILTRFFRMSASIFWKGRSFNNTWIILNEAEDWSAEQIKALINRAGKGCKVVILGNVKQIDNPYLTPESCGLSYVTKHFDGEPLFGHVILRDVERSDIADLVNRRLK